MQHPGCPGQEAKGVNESAVAHRKTSKLERQGREDQGRNHGSIQAVSARMLRK